MLKIVGHASLEALTDAIVPASIKSASPLALPPAISEAQALAELRAIAAKNRVLKSFIGQGYHGTHTPGVILRNILENPAWYTAYTPYQAEISQGRMEALINFQTMCAELTGMEIANASLLDEATAAAEAMTLAKRSAKSKSNTFLVSGDTHPQTIELLRTRAEPLDIAIELANSAEEWQAAMAKGDFFGVLIQYPASSGWLHDWTQDCEAIHARGALVVLEVALSVVLLAGAGLLIKSFYRLQQAELGFKTESLLTLDLSLSQKKYPQTRQIEAFLNRALEQFQALPGVEAAAFINGGPFSNWGAGLPLIREGHSYRSRDEMRGRMCGYLLTHGETLAALGLPLVRGRSFTAQDTLNAPPVVVINQAAADKFFPGENALGQRIRLGLPDNLLPPDASPAKPGDWLTVIGIVKNHQPVDLAMPYQPAAFLPIAQMARKEFTLYAQTLMLRTSQDPQALISAVRQRLHELDPDQPIMRIATMDARIADSLKPRRFNTALMSLFAALALTLAVIGLYGVLAYTVVQRRHEIGIRLALGAQPGDIVALVMKQGLLLTLLGMALGLAGAVALTRLLERLLYGVSATDLLTFVSVAALLLAVAMLACWIPARRAAKVDPMIALRQE